MKLGTMQAIEELQSMLNVIPAGQLITIAGQRKEAALKMAIEALRRQAGYPPSLPGYVTIDKVKIRNAWGVICLRVWKENLTAEMSCYISRTTLEALAAVFGGDIVTYTERTCYKDSEPLVCGLPVIYGDDYNLNGYIYLVVPEHKHK